MKWSHIVRKNDCNVLDNILKKLVALNLKNSLRDKKQGRKKMYLSFATGFISYLTEHDEVIYRFHLPVVCVVNLSLYRVYVRCFL